MNRRPLPRGPRPSPSRDFRALATPPAQRGLALPVRMGADGAPDTTRRAVSEAPDDADVPDGLADDALELRVRPGPDGARVATVAGALTTDDARVLRRLAGRLHDAADALEGGAP